MLGWFNILFEGLFVIIIIKVKINKVKIIRERKNWFVIWIYFGRCVKLLLFVKFLVLFEIFDFEVFVEWLVFKNNMLIDIRENFIIVGDKNGLDFLIVFIVFFVDMVIFIIIDELLLIVLFLNRKLDLEKSVLN